jgi:L-rhamnose mutarotase
MKKTTGILTVALMFAAAFMMFVAMSGTAQAEEPTYVNSLYDDKLYETYNEYHYPSGNRMFFLARRHEVKFDIHNGKFFQIGFWPSYHATVSGASEVQCSDYSVYFYTPTGKLFGIRRIKNLEYNRYHSIPHDDRSLNYDRLIVKVQNNTEYNKDFVFKVMDPVDAIKGTPIKGANFRVILLD